MGLVSALYVKNFVCRYDKEVGVPYFSVSDFVGLKEEAFSFNNSNGNNISYFYYYFDDYKEDRIVLFCPGIGPGHVSYFAEIVELAKRGYKVLTIDYQGCGYSGGKNLSSLNQPSTEVNELLDYLNLDKEIVLAGHSLGAYTALYIINLRKDIHKAVIISGFLSIPLLAEKLINSKFFVKRILHYEKKISGDYFSIDNLAYLKETQDKLFFIHSMDDGMVSYYNSFKKVEEINNPNIKLLKLNGRRHNPNYTDEAVKYMNEVFGTYNYLVKQKKIKSDADKVAYFKDVSIEKLTEQDQEIFNQICEFIG